MAFIKYPELNVAAVNKFLTESRKKDNEIHAFTLCKGGQRKVLFSAEPYNETDKREIYSLSKSFTSAAIGAAWDEGLIDIDEKLIDIFPEKLPATVSENLSKMTIRHCLTMTTGHSACVMQYMYGGSDPAKDFLAQEVKYKPGTYFMYNTGASCMLGLILEKLTGRRLFEYTYEKILYPLGIECPTWTVCGANRNEGGIGLHISLLDIEKFGLMLANKGLYNGKRILSENWVNTAGAAQVDNSINGDSGTGNWTSGYGFQFWRTAHDGYRGDGLKGQLCMIMPKNDCVVSIVGCTKDMEGEIADAVELAENIIDPNSVEPFYNEMNFPPRSAKEEPTKLLGKFATAEPNPMGIKSILAEKTTRGIRLTLITSDGTQAFNAGNGSWEKSDLWLPAVAPKIIFMQNPYVTQNIKTAASYNYENGVLSIEVRHLSNPHTVIVTAVMSEDTVTVKLECKWFGDMLADDAKNMTLRYVPAKD